VLPSLFPDLASQSDTFHSKAEVEEEEEVKDASKDKVWSCDIGPGMSAEMDHGNNNPAAYHADTSNGNDTADEI
jgi:hypothetical protein